MTDEQQQALALYGVPGVGAKTYRRLVGRFGSPGAVFAAQPDELTTVEGVGPSIVNALAAFDREEFVSTQRELMEQAGAVLVVRGDERYPPQLDVFVSAPPVLFVRGDPSHLQRDGIAIVGTRAATPYGSDMAAKLARGAVDNGLTVISGMAAGIDTLAHRAALDGDGITVAVFGCGVDLIYPVANTSLSERIGQSGCLVSHFPMGTPGGLGTFPARNAVVVGLSLGTIVVEAGVKSGALITADLTLRAGRPLFAVPGNADAPKSRGANHLFAKGALPATDIVDVLPRLGRTVESPRANEVGRKVVIPDTLTDAQKALLEAMGGEAVQLDDLCERLGRPVYELSVELTELELEGLVEQLPGKVFRRRG